ncbi:MAG: alanine racemase [Bdellovibrionaceae bacterium]|jgi:alanine racemase|nr:alanine racemase [Pseudobdellovibrionaceae bacterium]
MMGFRPAEARISRKKLLGNLRWLKQLSPHSFFCAMVKANAYGHGDALVSSVLLESSQLSALGVGLVEEGIALREQGIEQVRMIFFGVLPAGALAEAQRQRMEIVINDEESLHRLFEELKASGPPVEPIFFHWKWDTGMHRLGFSWEKASSYAPLWEDLARQGSLRCVGIMSHLAKGMDFAQGESSFSLMQWQRFQQAYGQMLHYFPQAEAHLFNTQGLVAGAQLSHQALVKQAGARVGIGLYGYLPEWSGAHGLRPVMDLVSEIVHVLRIKKGEGVSYGHSWVAPRDSWIGVIPLGYADGIPKLASNRAYVMMDGQRVPQVGNITMDSFMVDLTDLPDPLRQPGAPVLVFGDGPITAEDWAKWGQTMVWDILAGLSRRIRRRLVE